MEEREVMERRVIQDGAGTDNFNFSGRRSLHIQKHTCSSCGYPAAKIRGCTFTQFHEDVFETSKSRNQ